MTAAAAPRSTEGIGRSLPTDRRESMAGGRRATLLEATTLLQSGLDSRFDDFAFLAARTLRAPVAGVALVEGPHHRLWSAEGCGPARGAGTDPFCTALMRQPDPLLLVGDASADAALSDSPLVAYAPFIRAYAGIALRDGRGEFLGAIFVADPTLRAFSPADIAALKALAAGLVTVLTLHESVIGLADAVSSDFLTGLLNRAPFELRLTDALAAARPGMSCALICLDVDRFKRINDRWGHAVGDAVLVETATRLARSVRRSDCAARLSGDEFAVLMSFPAGMDDAVALMRRVLAEFERPLVLGGIGIDIRVSLGAALLPDDATEAAQILQRADAALYDAKRRGGACFSVHRPETELALQRQRTLRTDLAAALHGDEFHLAWQPIVSARDGGLHGYEALLRWDRPRHGPTPPAEFIPFAEESGQIIGIDTSVLGRACARASRLPGNAVIAVNVWPGWFGHGLLADIIRTTLDKCGLDAARLEIEVTERALIENGQATYDEMMAIRSLGVRLTLDDFGVGYSSLQCLSSFPFDALKLDATFVRDLCVNNRSRRIARHVLQLGHELGMHVCAEGVETESQRAMLQEDGYDWLQGFLLGPPDELRASVAD